jgi:hypothetical protein
MRVLTGPVAILGLIGAIVVGGRTAGAETVAIDAFFGVWHGNAISESEVSTNFRLTSRDLNVEIRPADGQAGAFTLEWATVQRQRGDPSNPREKIKVQTSTFVPAGKPNVWKAEDSGEPLDAGYVYARLRDQTLTVYSLEAADDGRLEVHIYKRTLTSLGMELTFTRLVDGEQIRSVKGRLVKFAK